MENRIKVSVIISAFNAEKTLEKSIQSILKQTLKEIELIIIDDGSKDRTAEIGQRYAQSHNVIFLQNKTNRGLGYSENYGVRMAKGKYIGFVDADDYVCEEFYETLYNAAEKERADIACGEFILVWPDKELLCPVKKDNLYLKARTGPLLGSSGKKSVTGLEVAGFWGGSSSCTKIIKRECLKSDSFYEGACCDDLPAVLPIVARSEKIAYAPNAYYYYVQTEDSMERTVSETKKIDAISSIGKTIERYEANGADEQYAQLIVASSLVNIIKQLLLCAKPNNSDLFMQIAERLRECVQDEKLLDILDEEKNPYLKYNLDRFSAEDRTQINWGLSVLRKSLAIRLKIQDIPQKVQMDNSPLVTIVIPVYNGENYLAEAIDSALRQTYSPIEILVVNDGSRDFGATDLIARSYGNSIRYIRKENGGVATALNCGIDNMRGEYFSWLSHDDMYLPDKIQHEMALVLRQDDPTTIIAEGYQLVNERVENLYAVNLHDMYTSDQLKRPLFPVFRGGINGCALLIHRSHFDRVGKFDPGLRTTQDYDMWFRMFRGKTIYYDRSCNVLSRVHEGQDSRALSVEYIKECEKLWISMMESLSDAERTEIDGSPYLFYHNMWEFLKNGTSYTKAIEHAAKKTWLCVLDEYDRNPEQMLQKVLEEGSTVKSVLGKDILSLRRKKHGKRLIFLLEDRSELSGRNFTVIRMAEYLAKDYDVVVACVGAFDATGYYISDAAQELYIPLEMAPILPKLLVALNPDSLISASGCNLWNLQICAEVQAYDVKTIIWNFESFDFPYRVKNATAPLSIRSEVLSKAAACIWGDDASKLLYERMTGAVNGAVISPLSPFSYWIENSQAKNNDRIYLMTDGEFSNRESKLELLLKVFAVVSEKYPEMKLCMLGGTENYRTQTVSKGVLCGTLMQRLNVTAAQIVCRERNPHIADDFENALVYIETARFGAGAEHAAAAIAQGIPVVCFEGGGADTVVEDQISGFIIPNGDWDAFAEKVLTILNNREMRRAMSGQAKNSYEDMWDNCANAWKSLIRNVLNLNTNQTEAMLEATDRQDVVTEILRYCDMCISDLVKCGGNMSVPSTEIQTSEWYEECMRIQSSLSWRITKPLRQVKKVFLVLKTGGIRAVLRKIIQKLK